MLPSMKAFVEVDGVLSGDNLFLSSFAALVHHFCSFGLSLSLSKLQSLALTAAAAKEKLGHHTGNIYKGLCFIGVALGFRLKYRNVLRGLTNKVNVCYKSRGNWVKSGRY